METGLAHSSSSSLTETDGKPILQNLRRNAMDKELWDKAREYELLTQTVYQSMIHSEGTENAEVGHNQHLPGRSGVKHQVDVFWKFKQAGIEHKVLVECKNYSENLSLEKVRNFFAVLHDIGGARGIMVTTVGYQSGASAFAEFYGIELKVLRKPTEEDWEGRVKNLILRIKAKWPVSTDEKPIEMHMNITGINEEHQKKLDKLKGENRINVPPAPSLRFQDHGGNPISEEMRYWLPRKLDILGKEAGGPYRQFIKLENHYVFVKIENGEDELVKVPEVAVDYYIAELPARKLVIQGDEIVQAILKDHVTGEVEHVQKK
jgi:hypothetical protein